MTKGMPPVRTAVIHPVDVVSLLGAIEAADQGLIIPVFIGPKARIRQSAKQISCDLSSYELIPTEHSEAAAVLAVSMARSGKVEALMKFFLTRPIIRAPYFLRMPR